MGFSERFTVQDSCCGLLESFPKLSDAKEFAARMLVDHRDLTIFDRMARKDGIQEWAWMTVCGKDDWFCKSVRPLDEGDIRHYCARQ